MTKTGWKYQAFLEKERSAKSDSRKLGVVCTQERYERKLTAVKMLISNIRLIDELNLCCKIYGEN